MDTRRRSLTLRILAPAALIVFGVALAMIISSANKSTHTGGTGSNAAEKQRDLGSSTTTKSPRTRTTRDKLPDRIYVVKSGDTLGSISEKVGVSVEKLQELNPNLDQFSLVAGQKIKIR
jgi:LysM repeat protein